jgi:hypothetical protein
MKLFLCAIAALTLSVSTMNAQENADAVTANKTKVAKKANKTQSVEMKKTATKESKSEKAVLREDTKNAKSDYNSTTDKASTKTDAQLITEKKAKQKKKQKVKDIDN